MRNIFILFFVSLYFTANAYTPEESCYMRTGKNGYIEINGKCVCAMPGYKDYGSLDCRLELDHASCRLAYGINAEMKTSGVCGCKAGNELIKGLNGNYSCKSGYAECRLRFGDNASYFSSSGKCGCKAGYKFSDTILFEIGLDDNYLVSNKCVKNDNIIIDNTESSNINSNNSDLVLDNSNSSNTEYIESAKFLAKNGIINNQVSEDLYNVNKTITRKEMLKIMMKLSGKDLGTSCNRRFKDLSKSDWGCPYAESALDYGYISNNLYFRPNDDVSKIEAIKMIFQSKGIVVEKTEDWRLGYINKGVELGLFDSFTDYNTKSVRGFIFEIASELLSQDNLGMILESSNNDVKENTNEEDDLGQVFDDLFGNTVTNSFSCGNNISLSGVTYQTKLLPDGKCWTNNVLKIIPNKGVSMCYDNKEENCNTIGRLYNFDAGMNVCSYLGEGWRLPSKNDYEKLKLNGATGWIGNKVLGLVNNLSGFFDGYGNFSGLYTHMGLMTSTQFDSSETYIAFLNSEANDIILDYHKDNNMGYSVLCIKD